MSVNRRVWVAIGCLAIGAAAHWGLQWHMSQAQAQPHPPLKANIESLPLKLAPQGTDLKSLADSPYWSGDDLRPPDLDRFRKSLPFRADGLIWRNYKPAAADLLPGVRLPYVNVYMVHSKIGEDRKHHPEVCIRDVGGKQEDRSFRKIVYLDKEKKRPAQRFRFKTGPAEFTTVYYWHYTIYPKFNKGQSFLQILHLQRTIPSPSITVQVSTIAEKKHLESVEKLFITGLDAQMEKHILPQTALVGCNRLPIAVLRERVGGK